MNIDVIQIIGHFLLWVTVFSFRKEESKINIFSIKWLVQVILITVAVILIKN